MKEAIAIVNRRGGVGKTATARALGAGLHLKGFNVLFIDLDSQCNLTFDLGAQPVPPGSMELLTGTAAASDVIKHTPEGDLIPASPSLAVADNAIDGTGKEYRLKEALEAVSGNYDYIIIDTPPALGVLTVNALTACNSVIIPAQAEVYSIYGIGLLKEAIEAVQKYTNKALKIRGILITRFNGRSIISRDMRENLEAAAKDLGTRVFPVAVRECTAIKEAQALQANIFQYAPRSNATEDYTALIEEILNNE